MKRSTTLPFTARLAPLVLLALFAIAPPAPGAVPDEEGATATLAWAEGEFDFLAGGREQIDPQVNTPVLPGDRIETRRGRLEVVLPGGSIVRFDRATRVSFERIAGTRGEADREIRLRLESGAIAIDLNDRDPWTADVRVETAAAGITLDPHGWYRVDADRRGATMVHVADGRAELRSRRERDRLRSDDWAWIDPDGRIEVADEPYRADRFDQWVDGRRERLSNDWESDEYLDGNLSWAAPALDEAGSWVWSAEYDTWVWVPRVSAGWRPYVDGRWYYTPAGLNWIPYEPWGWATMHYGTWAWNYGGWCWIPGRVWSPAWVYWYHADSYLGWCPTGYYDYWYGGGWGHHGFYWFDLHFRADFRWIDPDFWCFARRDNLAVRDLSKSLVPPSVLRREGDRLGGVVSSRPIRFEGASRLDTPSLASRLRERPSDITRDAGNRPDEAGRKFLARDRTRDLSGPASELLRSRVRDENNRTRPPDRIRRDGDRPGPTGRDGASPSDRGGRPGDSNPADRPSRPSGSRTPSDGDRARPGSVDGAREVPRPTVQRGGTSGDTRVRPAPQAKPTARPTTPPSRVEKPSPATPARPTARPTTPAAPSRETAPAPTRPSNTTPPSRPSNPPPSARPSTPPASPPPSAPASTPPSVPTPSVPSR